MTTIIHVDLDAVDERLDHGKLWVTGWGDCNTPESATCLHGAIRYCQPVPGDAYLIEQVGERFGFGTGDNDRAAAWAEIKAKVIPDITDTMLADTFGPQWKQIVNLVRLAATLTDSEAQQILAARHAGYAARYAAEYAAECAARHAARRAARHAAWDAAGYAAGYAARALVGDAARALVVRDLIGQYGFTQHHYDPLTGPWATVIGPAHPDDKPTTP